jgi:hypothetical protein
VCDCESIVAVILLTELSNQVVNLTIVGKYRSVFCVDGSGIPNG